MKLILINLTITNFKGIRSLSVDFDHLQTSIFAANEAGKTTISDAWHWLLTGKNSMDQKDFNIKNTVHTDLNRADHEVSAILLADNSEVTLKKIYREKWQKKRGEQVAEFNGHETIYYCNDVPLSQTEYQSKINGFLPENVLKMITNPLYFNSNTTQWGWQKRREVLLAMAGTISDGDVFDSITTKENRSAIQNLQFILGNGKSLLEYKKQIAARKKLLKDDLAAIPTRIDEITRSKPEAVDYVAIQKLIDTKNAEIAKLDQQLTDKSKTQQAEHEKIQLRQNEIHKLTTRRTDISYALQTEINNAKREINGQKQLLANEVIRLEREIQYIDNNINDFKYKRTTADQQRTTLRENWGKINEKEIEFDDHAFSCPTCQRAYETDNIEEMKAQMLNNFNTDKRLQLEQIQNQGKKVAGEIAELDESISNFQNKLDGLKTELAKAKAKVEAFEAPQGPLSLEEQLANNDEYVQLGSDIIALQTQNQKIKAVDDTEIIDQKRAIAFEIDGLKRQLNSRDAIERAEARIKELKVDESRLAQELADLEKAEFLIEDFNRSKMDILESRINGKFKHVKFKLFEPQINGGEVETCETMYKDVPFSDLNTAGKIWAGIDIINTLSAHYGVSAPIFLDNRESVSLIPETNSQIVNLVVSPSDKKIRVVAGMPELADVA